jgi:hypothetical protein
VLDVGGVVVDPTHSSCTYAVTIAGAAPGGAQVAWTDGRVEQWDVWGAHLDASAQPGPSGPLALSTSPEQRPKLAGGPAGRSLAVAVSEFAGNHRILAWRLDPAGQAMSAEPIEVAVSSDASTPSVAFDGTRYLIVWSAGDNILARRMLPDGSFVDARPTTVMPGWSPDVAALNGVFLVAGIDAPSSPQFASPFARRVDGATGALLDAAPVAIGNSFTRTLDVTAFGSRWLCVMQRNFSHDDTQSAVEAVFVDANGLSTQPITVVPVGGGAPAVDVSPTKALIAYRTGRSASADNDVSGRIMNLDGSFATDAFPISAVWGAGWAKQFAPVVAWSAPRFFVAWEDQRNQVNFFDLRSDIYGAHVNEFGRVLDPEGFVLADGRAPDCSPALLGNNGTVLFAASIMRPAPPFSTYRMGTRVLSDGCPAPVLFCTSLPDSTGQAATMSVTGSTSLSADAMTLTCSGLPSGSIGLFFHGSSALDPSLPFGNGVRCAGGSTHRLPVLVASGGFASQAQSFTWPAYAGLAAGDTLYFQLVFRDAAGGGALFNSSDAYAVTFCP